MSVKVHRRSGSARESVRRAHVPGERSESDPPTAQDASPADVPGSIAKVTLQRGRTRLFRHERHLLVYAAAVSKVTPKAGESRVSVAEPVAVVDGTGVAVAYGFYNQYSKYAAARVLATADELERERSQGNDLFDVSSVLTRRIGDAFAVRASIGLPNASTNVFRAINGDGDRLSGLAVDVYDKWAVVVSSALWVERFRLVIEDAVRSNLARVLGVDDVSVVWRSSHDRLRQDGLDSLSHEDQEYFTGIDFGSFGDHGNAPSSENDELEKAASTPERTTVSETPMEQSQKLVIRENDVLYSIPVPWLYTGQKSGFYVDQSERRSYLRQLVKNRGRPTSVLDCYTFCGGFAISAALGGAESVIAVDSSRTSLASGEENAQHNGVKGRVQFIQDDVPNFLRTADANGDRYDIVILDPPKLAPSKAVLEKATNKYMKINAAALRVVAPGGLLLTVSSLRLRPLGIASGVHLFGVLLFLFSLSFLR